MTDSIERFTRGTNLTMDVEIAKTQRQQCLGYVQKMGLRDKISDEKIAVATYNKLVGIHDQSKNPGTDIDNTALEFGGELLIGILLDGAQAVIQEEEDYSLLLEQINIGNNKSNILAVLDSSAVKLDILRKAVEKKFTPSSYIGLQLGNTLTLEALKANIDRQYGMDDLLEAVRTVGNEAFIQWYQVQN